MQHQRIPALLCFASRSDSFTDGTDMAIATMMAVISLRLEEEKFHSSACAIISRYKTEPTMAATAPERIFVRRTSSPTAISPTISEASPITTMPMPIRTSA